MTIADNFKECDQCENAVDENMICCEGCHKWRHLECCRMDADLKKIISSYYCDDCVSEGKRTKWDLQRASNKKRIDKINHYYDIEAIKSMETRADGSRIFLLQWKGYREMSWEPEKHLDGAYELLQEFLQNFKQPFSKINGMVGAPTDSNKTDERNWVSLDMVVDKIKRYQELYCKTIEITIDIWKGKPTSKGIYLISLESHCYVTFVIPSRNMALVGDGMNFFIDDEEVNVSIKRLLGIRSYGMRYEQQIGIDHCASSAVLIALDFMRMEKTSIIPTKLTAPKELIERLMREFHQYKSEVISDTPLHQHRVFRQCPKCKKNFNNKQRRNFIAHCRKCKEGE